MKRGEPLPPLWSVLTDRRGVAAVEFALVSPIFALLLAGTVDIGGALYVKFNLDSAVSSAADYALLNAANVESTDASTLANQLATIVASSKTSAWANATITVNNGPTATLTSGTVQTSGTASNADLCYCPTLSSSSIVWGSSVSCSSTCASGALAGKYISIMATHTYQPWFASYNIVTNDTISASSVVKVQ